MLFKGTGLQKNANLPICKTNCSVMNPLILIIASGRSCDSIEVRISIRHCFTFVSFKCIACMDAQCNRYWKLWNVIDMDTFDRSISIDLMTGGRNACPFMNFSTSLLMFLVKNSSGNSGIVSFSSQVDEKRKTNKKFTYAIEVGVLPVIRFIQAFLRH